jgi:hypothetical protein
MIAVNLPDGRSINVDTDDRQVAAEAARKFLANNPMPASAVPPRTDFMSEFEREENNRLAQARARLEAAQAAIPERETGIFEDITSGFGAGVVGVGEMAALGLATPLEEESELAARDKIQSIAESFRPEGGDPDSISYKLSSALGSIAGLAAVPAAAALTPIGPVGALGLGAVAAGAAGAGEASERARAAEATEEERGDAALRGAFIGLLDVIPIARVLPTSKLPELAKLLEKIPPEKVETIGERIYSAGITGGAEAAQEAASNVLQNLNEQEYNAAAETFGGTAEEAALGGGAGAILQGFVDLFAPRRAKGPDPVTPVPTEETPIAPVTPITEADIDADVGAAVAEVTDETLDADATLDDITEAEREEAEREEAEREEAEKEKLAAAIEAGEEKGAVTRTTEDGKTTTTVQTQEQLRGQVGADTTVNDSFLERVLGKNYKRTSIYRRYKDADLTDPDVRDDLRREAAQPRKNKAQIQENLNKEFDALGPPKERVDEQGDTDTDTEGELDATGSGTGDAVDPQGVGVTASGQDSVAVAGTDGSTVGDAGRDIGRADVGEGGQFTALAELDTRLAEAEEGLKKVTNQTPSKANIRYALKFANNIRPESERASNAELKIETDTEFKAQNAQYKANVAAAQAEVDRLQEEKRNILTEFDSPIQKAETKLIEARGTEAEPEAVEGFNRAYEEVYGTPEEVSKREFIGRSRQTKAPPLPEQDQQAIQQFLTEYDALSKTAQRDAPTEVKAVADYLKLGEATGDPAKGLTFAAYDVSTGASKVRQASRKEARESPEKLIPRDEAALTAGMGREKGQAVLDWANANLSPTAQARIEETTQEAQTAEFELGVGQRRREAAKDRELLERAQRKKAASKPLTKEETARLKKFKASIATPSPRKEVLGTAKGAKAEEKAIALLSDVRKRAREGDVAAQQELAARKADEEKARQAEKDSLVLPKNAALSTTLPMPDAATAALRNGDLKGALEAIAADAPNPAVKRFARKLAENVGTTKVSLVEDLQNEGGDFVYGLFDPKTNTISLDAAEGQTVHALVHEMGHAGVSATLADAKNPLTIQLQKVFDDVKDKLKSHYGSQDIQEFAAEYMSNPEFRSELALLSTPKAPSVLRKVSDIINKIVRKILGVPPKKGKEDSLNAIDELIETIIAPAPESRGAGQLLMASKDGKVAKLQDRETNNAVRAIRDIPNDTVGVGFKQLFGTGLGSSVANSAKSLGLGFLNNSAFNDIANVTGVQSIKSFTEAIEKSNGAIEISTAKLNAITAAIERKLQAANKADPDGNILTVFNNLTTDSTMARVDPSKPKSTYKGEKLKLWEVLNAEYEKLGPDGQAAYVQLRDTYRGILDDLKESLGARIDSAITDKEQAEKLKNQLYTKIFDRNLIEPYFPLARKGDSWLKWFVTPVNADGSKGEPREVIEAFGSPNARKSTYSKLLALAKGEGEPVVVDGVTYQVSGIQVADGLKNMTFDGGTAPTSFVTQMVTTLNQSIPDGTANKEATINSIVQEFITALPESSFLKAFKKREDKLGAADDALDTLRVKGYGMANRAANLKSSENIRTALSAVREEIKTSNNEYLQGDNKQILMNELEARKELTINPPNDFWNNLAKQLNRFAFIGTMGFNAASTISNGFQVPAVVMPYLQGKTDFRTASKAVNAGFRLFTGSNIEHKVETYGGEVVGSDKNIINSYTPSIDNYFLLDADGKFQMRDDLPDLDTPNYYQKDVGGGETVSQTKREFLEELMPVIQEANERSFLTRSAWADYQGIDMAAPKEGIYDTFSRWSALPFHTVERMGRQTTVVAAYLNEMARLNTKPNKAKGEDTLSEGAKRKLATQVAMQETSQLNGGSALNTAPRIAQSGPIGRLAMMFKTYGFTMYYNQFKMMAGALKQAKEYGMSEEQGRIAMKQFIASNGYIAALAGVQGIPLVGIFQGIADLYLDDDEEDADLLSRRFMGDPLYRGGVQYLTNFLGFEADIAARIGLSNLILGNNRYDFNKSAKEEVFDFLGGPALGYGSSILRGANDMYNGETRRGIESMLPAAFRNILQAERFATEGAETRRGDPITDDFNAGEVATKFLGFAPARYTNAQERNQDIKKIQKTVSRQKSRLLKRYYIALRQGDNTSDILNEIIAHNRRHSDKGKEAIITTDTIERSMKQHARTSLTMHNGVTLTPTMRLYAQDMQEELEYQPWYMNN